MLPSVADPGFVIPASGSGSRDPKNKVTDPESVFPVNMTITIK